MSKMHDNEFNVDIDLVRGLINEQFPEFSKLPISSVSSVGTVNNIFRLGQELYIRLPRVADWVDVDKEFRWLQYLAPHLTLKIPEPVALGQPTSLYPAKWAIYRWIRGNEYSDELIHDECEVARDLANFVNELWSIDVPKGAPRAGRAPLLELNSGALEAIEETKDIFDSDRVLKAWEESCGASVWNGQAVWIHADLLRTNLLVDFGRLTGVIDFGSAGIGDPAFDLIPAWSVFGSKGRRVFQNYVAACEDVWLRARGYAFYQALRIIPYYRETFPKFARLAIRTVNEILWEME